MKYMILHTTSTPTHILLYFIHTKKDKRSAASSCSSTAADFEYRHERLMNPAQRGRSCSVFLDVVRQPIAVGKASTHRHCSSLVALGLMIPTVLFFFCRLLQNYSLALTQGLFKLVASGNPFPFVQFIQN